MPARASEAIVLRTYPFRESDVVVSFFTRDQGKLRGTARAVRKTKNNFGAGLERLSLVKMYYSQKESAELVTCTACDLIESPFDLMARYEASVALDFVAEVTEFLLPLEEPNETFFRLLLLVLEYLHQHKSEAIWPAVTYFLFWAVRLSGILPELKMTRETREIVEEIVQKPLGQLSPRTWTKQTAENLRHQLVRQVQHHVEKKLLTVPLLEAL